MVDPEAVARAVLAETATATPKTADGPVEAMRILELATDSAVKGRVQALNQLDAVLVNADPALREARRHLRPQQLIAHCVEMDADGRDDVAAATVHTLRQLARRIHYLAAEIRDFERRIAAAVASTAPQLPEVNGIGPDAAATLLITAGANPQRRTSEASFAALRGVSPVEASSGRPSDAASTEAATAEPTPPSTAPS
ncbi:transposase [Pseudonocardia bannensis]|uniref:transposase n=1 Tax=Pseudonocardia bannensis TaxID=630973 RepID=UPI001B7D00AC|nr:transposase [Pseudonocardia bannensis]